MLVYSSNKPIHALASVNGTTYSYDANGNLTSRGSTSYTYDWANQLVKVVQPSGTTEYRYDADGTLVQRIDSSGTTHLIGELYERAPNGTITKRYYLGSRLIGSSVGGAFTFLYSDYLNSTVSAGNGATTEYTPFGLVRTSSGTLPTNRQFQGQQHESAVGLYKMGARWYDPAVGLWTQPDTIVPNPLNPQDYHRYAFVRNNPLRQVDPTGHNPEDPCLIKGICAGEPSTTPNTDDPTGNTACGAGSLNFIDCALGYLLQTHVLVCFSGWSCIWIDVGVDGWGPFTPDDSLASSEIEFEAESQKAGSLKFAKRGTPAGVLSATTAWGEEVSAPLFEKAGIETTEHFLLRLAERRARGVTEPLALRAYTRGRLFYDIEYRTYIRYDSQTGIGVAVSKPSGGVALTVFEGNPSPRWRPVRWRPG